MSAMADRRSQAENDKNERNIKSPAHRTASLQITELTKRIFEMDGKRFIHLRELLGYDNVRMSKMLNIELSEVEAFCRDTKPIPDKLAKELEDFVDWSCEVSHTETKRDLAEKYLN